ncbi:helix-turn-helix transcriptional regulator [Sphaerisporangium aureirubrum]|uniref:LuxR C-terminal-related transcriptional regulator n=1 Tax=Sphaerisporangium aureirubrum TaxID=1544736 RepID=A0ABW1NL03_9ACTN
MVNPALGTVIGRDIELDALRRALRNPVLRLLTITGPPGVGKSRLLTALYPELVAEFGEGVRFLDFAARIGHGVQLTAHSACLCVGPLTELRSAERDHATLNLFQSGGEPLCGQERERPGGKGSLVLIDHAEPGLEEIARVVTKSLAARPGLRVVLACREPLGVYGERLFPVQPLAVPGSRPPAELAELGRIASVRLLLERVTATRPDVVLTGDNREVITELSNGLDGLPLAIEFAAARLRLFQLRALLNRLRTGLDILYGGAPHTLSHHRSMKAAIAWSHGRLTEHERDLLRRLAVLTAGFDMAAAEAVSDLGGGALHDALQRLAERNLITVAGGPDGEPCFSLLNTIRLYVLQEPAGTGEPEAPAPPGPVPVPVPVAGSPGEPEAGLTRREHQVAVLVAQGLTNRQIARRLGIAEWTAVNHVRNVMRKMRCSSRVHVASMITQGSVREMREVSGG